MSRAGRFSRRGFGRLLGKAALGSAALAAAGEGVAVAAGQAATPGARQFPPDFLWGSATASYQVEGAANEDGRGPSIWDTFSHTPGKIVQNMTGDVADDDYHRYAEDLRLAKDLGIKGQRFSISWSRIYPTGTGAVNQKGLDHYSKVVDAMLANGIQPFCTLFHWDLPQALQDRVGGWESRDTSKAFGEYAGTVAKSLSDRVKSFMTMNEFSSFIDLGYKEGHFAPGLKLPPGRLNQARHCAVLAHGLAVQAIRANGRQDTKVGLAENAQACTPVVENEEHIRAAEKAMRILNAPYLTVIMEGKYPEEYLRHEGANAPKFTPEDLAVIGGKLDFLGLNVYTPTYIMAADNENGFRQVPNPASYPHMLSTWLSVGPEALYWSPRHVNKLWNVNEIYITENGTSSSDHVTADGRVDDTDRVMYLRNYISQLQRAVSDGVPVRGYFCWSLLDNYEWADGYTLRFGLYYVDFKTQKRIPKLSAAFYKETIARNAVS